MELLIFFLYYRSSYVQPE